MIQPSFSEILDEAKAIAIREQEFEVVGHFEFGIPPVKHEAHLKVYNDIIDRAWIKLNVEKDRA